jgi:type IV pilus assembly protein PilC
MCIRDRAIIINFCKGKLNITPIILKLKVVKEYYEYLFILNLSIILNSAISLHSSLEHCASNTEELVLKNELLRVNRELLLGNELSKSLERNCFLSKQSMAIIKIGETSGSLASIVEKAEGRLEENLNNDINKLTMKIQPIVTVIMAVVIGGFIVTLIMPLLTMMYK